MTGMNQDELIELQQNELEALRGNDNKPFSCFFSRACSPQIIPVDMGTTKTQQEGRKEGGINLLVGPWNYSADCGSPLFCFCFLSVTFVTNRFVLLASFIFS